MLSGRSCRRVQLRLMVGCWRRSRGGALAAKRPISADWGRRASGVAVWTFRLDRRLQRRCVRGGHADGLG
eukprot:7140112-Alexandrium_andersonii.AAC.2